MVFLSLLLAVSGLCAAQTAPAPEGDDLLGFLAEEAKVVKVVTASRLPAPIRRAPATTYVVTAEDIKLSGATTLYDALRGVPGVDIIGEREFEGDIGIRGLNGHAANRVLVLLDGKTVLNSVFDSLDWESIPVGVTEIDRIEIVEGPASALYGGNAESGVVNIITKRPEQIAGVETRYSAGNRGLHLADAVAASKTGAWGTRLGAGYRTINRVDAPGHPGSTAGRADGLVEWVPDERKSVALSGGLVHHNTQVFGPPTGAFDDGYTSFVRGDARYGATKGRFFWNAGRSNLAELTTQNSPALHYDTFDATLERSVDVSAQDALTLNGEWRRNQAQSSLFDQGPVRHDLFSFAAENQWRFHEKAELIAGARVDHHPIAKWVASPRASLMWYPNETQTVRASFGDAFRNPTLLESDLHATVKINPALSALFTPVSNLRAERIRTFELAWRGAFRRARLSATAFHYKITSQIGGSAPVLVSAGPPALIEVHEVNRGGTRAMGYELGAEVDVSSNVMTFANYSYQSLKGENPAQQSTFSSPKHKGNAGLRLRAKAWTAQLAVNAVATTWWSGPDTGRVPAYAILNAYLGYRFSGRLEGLELAASGFNVTDNAHYEILPYESAANPGIGGALMRARWMGTASYKF